jgi:hypothetical protein
MRLWSIHPKYLDSKGLVALWRESLLAKNVLDNKTRGYKNHPQLLRFRQSKDPLHCIDQYLLEVYSEARRRNYSFDSSKIKMKFGIVQLTVTTGQLAFEIKHLKGKLRRRDKQHLKEIIPIKKYDSHPLFTVIEGDIEPWEKI